MYRWLRCLFLLAFPLSVSTTIIGTPSLQAQQAEPASSNATPDNPPGPPADGSRQAPDSSTNWKKDLLRDAMQMGMRKLQHGNGNMNAGGFAGSGDRDIPSPGSPTSDSGSEMHINPNIGAGIGSSDFNGDTASGFTGSTGSAFGNGTGNGFGNSMNRPANFGGTTGLGALSQLDGDLSRGLGAGGHSNAAAALGVLPSFNQFLHGGLSLPASSSFGNFRLSYQSPFSVTNNFQMKEMNGYGSGFATYDSPHLRSGRVDFSASAKIGMGNGINQGGFGAHGPDGHGGNSSDPSTSLAFHLSF